MEKLTDIAVSEVAKIPETDIIKNVESRIDENDRDALVVAVKKDYTKIVQALIDSAIGMCVEKTIDVKNHRGVPQGLISHRVYMMKPNTDVAQYLLNQLIGKPKETQIMEGQVIFRRDI